MTEDQSKYTFDRVVRMVLSAIVLVVVFLLIRHLADVLLPFAAAVVLAYLLNPLVTMFEKKTGKRSTAVAITLTGLTVIGASMVVLIVPLMLSQVGRFQKSLIQLRDDFGQATTASSAHVTPSKPDTHAEIKADDDTEPAKSKQKTAIGWSELREGWELYRRDAATMDRPQRFALLRHQMEGTYLGTQLDNLIEYSRSDQFSLLMIETAKRVVKGGWSILSFGINLLLGLTGLIIVLLYLIFLLLDFPSYQKTWQTFLPPQYRDSIVDFLQQFNAAMRRYFRGQSLVAMLMAILFIIGFTLIGLPMAVPLGLLIGLLNMVPYLQTVGTVPAILLAGLRAVEQDSSFAMSVLLTLAVFAVAQLIQDTLITPRVMGKTTGLSPVAILLGVFIWGKLLGFLGLLLAIPLTCLMIAYYRRFVLLYAAETTKITD